MYCATAMPPRPGARGVGALSPLTSGVINTGGMIGGAVATAAVASIAASGGTVLGIAASSLVPVVGPIIAGVTFAVQMLIANSGCGQTCIVTSSWADQAQVELKKNIDAYFALPAPRSKAQQVIALANFDTVWQQLTQMCSQPSVGDAGKACIADRQQGACKWRATENSQWPGGVQLGQCFNWFAGFRDPIAHDTVASDSNVASILSDGSADGGSLWPLAAIAGLILVGVAL